MGPNIVINIPWWVWVLSVAAVIAVGIWAIYTEPDPEPSFKNHIRHLISIWARHSMQPQHRNPAPLQRREDPTTTTTAPPVRGFQSRGEQICRQYMEDRFGVPFDKARPDFLRNPVTGENLELDMYNPSLQIAVEYNGKQHYQFNSHFHQSSTDRFQNQQYRDLIKKQLCEQNNVELIIVPYWIPNDEIPSFIDEQLNILSERLGEHQNQNDTTHDTH